MLAPWPQCHDVSHAGVSSGGPALLQGGRDRRDPSRALPAFESHTHRRGRASPPWPPRSPLCACRDTPKWGFVASEAKAAEDSPGRGPAFGAAAAHSAHLCPLSSCCTL